MIPSAVIEVLEELARRPGHDLSMDRDEQA
jgi:hypothetical protein